MCRYFGVGISPNMKPPCFDWYLSSITPNREHIKRLLHLAPLEFHHRGDLPQPPSLVATVLSRSTFDLTEVSLSPLPVIAVIEFAFQCLSPEVLYRSSLIWLVRPNSRRNVSDVLIFYFQGANIIARNFIPSILYLQP
jgi:hypothetical protein